eukprot:m.305794 g.305794  ORF g.305794 m.305794 type:complete len:52 (-) comp15911_c0_seq8:1426-1581(-)
MHWLSQPQVRVALPRTPNCASVAALKQTGTHLFTRTNGGMQGDVELHIEWT